VVCRWLSLSALTAAVPVIARAEEQSPGPKPEGWHLLDLGSRRRVFFKYEKRIRELSSPDKVFDYFASVTHDGTRYRTAWHALSHLRAHAACLDNKCTRSNRCKLARH
jgi:hypothetical protein